MDTSVSMYHQICSARTVQSEKKGFFNDFYKDIKESCGEKWLQNYFGKLKSNEARILSIFSDRELYNPVMEVLGKVGPVYRRKGASYSAQHRQLAENYQLLDCTEKALAHLNIAVMRAPGKGVDPEVDNGLTLALALRKRAGILINLRNGHVALDDLKQAAAFGLESKGSVDYYIQMAKAYGCIGDLARAEISLKLAETLAGGSNELIDECRLQIPFLKNIPHEKEMKVPTLKSGENVDLRGASSLVMLAQAPDRGRFIVAKDDLKTGDVVLCEQPVAACLLPTFLGNYCYHCFNSLITPVPCVDCAGVGFCKMQCMREACSTYHRFECPLMDLLIGSGMSILCFIALRIFTQAKDLQSGLMTANTLYANLCSHPEMRQTDDHLQRSLMAVFLLRCLQTVDYFGPRTTDAANPTAVELQVGIALLGLLQVLQYNAHEIYGTVLGEEHRIDGSRALYVGAGLYATGAYFNHECWPSVARYFVGKRLVLVATRPHKPNEVVAENYGPIFINVDMRERQKTLRARYLFDCNCSPCQGNWPTLQNLNRLVKFWCPTPNCGQLLKFPKDLAKDVRCTQCRKNVSLKESVAKLIKIEEIYRKGAEAMLEQKTGLATELFKEGIDSFFEIATLPHKDTLIAQQSLTKCLADTGSTLKQ